MSRQRQGSVTDQMAAVMRWAVENGCGKYAATVETRSDDQRTRIRS